MTANTTDRPLDKRVANVTAQLALEGFQVHAVTTGGYFVARWNLTKFCAAVEDLEAFARQVGAIKYAAGRLGHGG